MLADLFLFLPPLRVFSSETLPVSEPRAPLDLRCQDDFYVLNIA